MSYTVSLHGPKTLLQSLRKRGRGVGLRIRTADSVESGPDAHIVLADHESPRRQSAPVFIFDAVAMHPALVSFADQMKAGAVGTPGFFRIRLTVPTPPAKTRPQDSRAWTRFALASPVYWMSAHLPPVVRIFAQVSSEVPPTPRQVLATMTHADGAITQLNVSARPGEPLRCEAEVVGTDGLMSIDTHEEVALQQHYRDKRATDLVVEEAESYFLQQLLAALDDPYHPLHEDLTTQRRTKKVIRAAEQSVDRGRVVSIRQARA